MEAIHIPTVLIGNDHGYREANMASRLFLRRTVGELRSLNTYDLIPPRQHPLFVARCASLLSDGEVAGSASMRTPDGAEIRVDYRGAANVLPGIHLLLWMPSRWADDELDRGLEEPRRPAAGRLTVRERHILALLAAGATLEQIAEQRNVAVSTVRTQLRNGMRRLGARHRAHAVAVALREGEITLPEAPPTGRARR